MLQKILARPNDDKIKTIFVALVLSLVCSIVVSVAAVSLKPLQEINKAQDRKLNILKIAGLVGLNEKPNKDKIDELFGAIEAQVVDLETGEYVSDVDATTYDQRKAATVAGQNITIVPEDDIASIKRRAKYANVYLLKEGDQLKTIILPIHGYGLWSTLYGFIALKPDTRTVVGLGFYEHAETPGLGGEVDNPNWRSVWQDKLVYDESGQVAISVLKGAVDATNPQAQYQVDGLSGATLTARGVENMLHYWLGEQGFQPYLNKMKSQGGQ